MFKGSVMDIWFAHFWNFA